MLMHLKALNVKRQTIATAACTVALLIAVNANLSFAAQDWIALKKSGEVADIGAEYSKAITFYSQALKQIRTTDESQIIYLEARLATDYVHLFDFAKAEPLSKHVMQAMPALKKSKRYDPEVLVAVKYLAEAYHATASGNLPAAQRRKNFIDYDPISLDLLDLVSPNDAEIYARRFSRARGYIHHGEPEKADQKLGQLLAQMPRSADVYEPALVARAALECKLLKPQLMLKLQKELPAKYPPEVVLVKTGRGHLFAANYENAEQDLKKAIALCARKKPPNVECEIEAHRYLMDAYDDMCRFNLSEPHARKIVDLVSYSKGVKSDDYTKAVGKLIFYLKKNQKPTEVKLWQSKIPNTYDWLLDDEKAPSSRKN